MTPNTETHPTSAKRHAALDALLRIIDVTVGLAVLASGVFAIVATPPSVTATISLPLFVALWGGLLIAGGFSSALGRLTGIWILETTGIAAAGFGALIYLVIVSSLLVNSLDAAVAITLILVALLALLRRYVELQMLLSEPGQRGFIVRLQALLRVRTVASLRD